MARRNKLNIGGIDFELCGTVGASHGVAWRTLYDCYERPSARKQAIWDEWNRWFRIDMESGRYGVRSYNCSFFTITGVVEWEGKFYFLDITASHNRAYEMIDEN